jgi:hypothetical protein
MRKLFRILLVSFSVMFFLLGFLRLAMIFYANTKTVKIASAAPVPVVIVPGAGLSADGTPSAPLRDRVRAVLTFTWQVRRKKS